MLNGKKSSRVDLQKVKVLKEWQILIPLADIRSFFWLLPPFRRFISNFGEIATPLANLMNKGSGVHDWD